MTKKDIDMWVDWIQWQVKQKEFTSVSLLKSDVKKLIYEIRRLHNKLEKGVK